MGRTVDVGEEVDFDPLLDTPVQIVVIIHETGYSRIESVLPFPQPNGKKKEA